MAIEFAISNNLSNRAGDELLNLMQTVQGMCEVGIPSDFRKMVSRISKDYGRQGVINTHTINISEINPVFRGIADLQYR